SDKVLIIDAKYYSRTMQHNLGSTTFHSANMYQIYAYVKNLDKNNTGNVSGMLLYAHTNEEKQPDNEYIIGGNKISLKTLNLNCDFEIIKNQLDSIAESFLY
ncbi:MAG: 5-methylcytosine-specific restriction endonuclease system specificity protein McrC, partial [Clostridia bacterium]|nr:5-methylcytosine-specific restriction endonuclease system specificity protein McrC [Clostridia bacterium]